jgi:hypothetical protein
MLVSLHLLVILFVFFLPVVFDVVFVVAVAQNIIERDIVKLLKMMYHCL